MYVYIYIYIYIYILHIHTYICIIKGLTEEIKDKQLLEMIKYIVLSIESHSEHRLKIHIFINVIG